MRERLFNAHWFQLHNAIGFQIMMGAPVILFAKSLGASSTVLGVIAAFTPLLMVMQLPAAKFLAGKSYRAFVLGGWSLRTLFIFVVAAVPLLGFLDDPSKMALLLAALFFFNLLRGISTAGWMPWITAVVSADTRGRFLALDQLFMYVGCLVALVVSALVMSGDVAEWEFSVVFLLSAVASAASLIFIRKIPDAPADESTARFAQSVPWRAILAYPPFARLLAFNVLFMVVLGSLNVFTVEYLRAFQNFGIDVILYLAGISFVGPIVSLVLSGKAVDAVGSKPVLRWALGAFLVVLAGWALIAAGVLPCTVWAVAGLNFLSGLAGANFHLANQRITMATMPEMGRNHFFALFTVITGLGLGAAPVVWGVSLDAIGTYEWVAGWFTWRKHSIYFVALFAITAITLVAVSWLSEGKAGDPDDRDAIEGRFRRLARTWQR